LRDIEQARQRLDDVLDTGEKLLRALMDLQSELVVGMFEQADTQLDKAVALNTELAREIRRLMLILTRRDALVRATMDYRNSFGPVSRYVEALASGAPHNDETWKAALSDVAKTHARVIDIAVERIGSNLGEPVS
jgi:hypothetical protein